MKARAVVEFLTGASLAAAAGAVALAAWTAAGSSAERAWAFAGFTAVALPAVVCGAWLAREHGRPGSRFVAAFAAGLGARAIGVLLVMALSLGQDAAPRRAAVSGLALAFVSVMLFELIWFARGGAPRASHAEARR